VSLGEQIFPQFIWHFQLSHTKKATAGEHGRKGSIRQIGPSAIVSKGNYMSFKDVEETITYQDFKSLASKGNKVRVAMTQSISLKGKTEYNVYAYGYDGVHSLPLAEHLNYDNIMDALVSYNDMVNKFKDDKSIVIMIDGNKSQEQKGKGTTGPL
jgi:hypothetical protein